MSRQNIIHSNKRNAYIETELLWGDGLTAGRLAQVFGITRPAAQEVIARYRKSFTDQMRYDRSLKRHVPTESFKASFIRDSAIAFLDYLRGQALVGMYHGDQDWSDLAVTDVDRLMRPDLKMEPMRVVLAALRAQSTVMIDYRSKNLEQGSVSVRVVSPHHLIFADDRYHLRAFCHKKARFLDFVLSRIVHAEQTNEGWIGPEDDAEWNEFVEVHVQPNPALPSSVQEAILMGFGSGQSGFRTIRCRKALLFYIERKLFAIDPKYGVPLWQTVKPE